LDLGKGKEKKMKVKLETGKERDFHHQLLRAGAVQVNDVSHEYQEGGGTSSQFNSFCVDDKKKKKDKVVKEVKVKEERVKKGAGPAGDKKEKEPEILNMGNMAVYIVLFLRFFIFLWRDIFMLIYVYFYIYYSSSLSSSSSL
jgi:hypothetical protein